MIILGIHDGHNASAALLVDGAIVAAVAEERLTGDKNEYGFPAKAIESCFRSAGISAADVDQVALGTKSLPPMYFITRRNVTFTVEDYWREQKEYWKPKLYEGKDPKYLDIFAHRVDYDRFPYDRSLIQHEGDTEGMLAARLDLLQRHLGIAADKITVYDHHSCHAYYGYMACPDRDRPLVVFTSDGGGDATNGTVWIGNPGEALKEISRSGNCNIGRLYRYATLLLGMRPADHEYKVMGLAPYGSPTHSESAYQVYADTLQVDGLKFTYRTQPQDHFFYFKDRLEGHRFDNIARAIQTRTEELLTEWILNGVTETGLGDVVFSGGVAQNIKANKLIWEMEGVNSLYIPAGPGDESISVGAAYQAAVEHTLGTGGTTADIAPLNHAYIGPSYTDDEVSAALESAEKDWEVRRATPDDVAALLAEGEVVARFGADRMEFGPRALGNRSIIADPRRPGVVQHINSAIKMRDFWMPFAPSVLAERAGDYFVNPKGIDAPYMTIGFDTTPLGRDHVAAGLHPFDKSARPQLVSTQSNPGYHAVISAFERLTGVGAVLNTSFNIHGEPIVATPADALDTFSRCGLRHLALGDWLVSKPA